ncbi:hypothetical protein Pelo_10224 [Pelomyxa schiedti]|nr:hypothetical protein Pelo_10224 [Pelomyxa schiedti]
MGTSRAIMGVMCCLCTCLIASAAQTGSACKSALTIGTVPYSYSGSTATLNVSSHYCNSDPSFNISKTQYFSFVLSGTSSKWLTASLCGSTSMDTLLYIYSTCTGAGDSSVASSCVAWSDDKCGLQSEISYQFSPGITYYFGVTGWGNNAGFYTFDLYETPAPTNDECASPIAITFLPYVISGDTSTCVSGKSICRNNTAAAGLWYSYVGNDTEILVQTCDETEMDTIIEVYRGCNLCLTYNDDSCLTQSQVVFEASKGVTYYIFVTGYQNQRGTFFLTVANAPSADHHTCTEAVEIKSLPYVVTDSNALVPTSTSECAGGDRHALFYVLHGTGATVMAATCTSENTAFDTIVEVYDSCLLDEGHVCIAWNDDYCGVHSMVKWEAEDQFDYYISVAGYRADINGGNFTLYVDYAGTQLNDVCWQATVIDSLPWDASGSTTGVQQSVCGGCSNGVGTPKYGLWYEILLSGPARPIEITACNNETSADVTIEVYTSCQCVECVTKDTGLLCSGKGNVQFMAGNNVPYFVYATTGTDVGFFHLDFIEDVPNEYSHCTSALPITQLPWSYTGSTMTSESSYSPCTYNVKQGMWFSVTGTGNKMAAFTCSQYSDFDTFVSVHINCGNTSCLAYNDDYTSLPITGINCGAAQSYVTWTSEMGQIYYVLVNGWGDSIGVFQFSVIEETTPVNDDCAAAIDLSAVTLPYTLYGFTPLAVPSGGDCDTATRQGVWYKMLGVNNTYQFSTCHYSTTFDTRIEVYTSCSSTYKNASGCRTDIIDDGTCPLSLRQSVTFTIPFGANKDGSMVWVFVTGDDSAQGLFQMAITDHTPSPKSEGDNGLSAGAKAGIVFAVFGGIACLAGAGFAGWWYYTKHYKPQSYAIIPDTTATSTSH